MMMEDQSLLNSEIKKSKVRKYPILFAGMGVLVVVVVVYLFLTSVVGAVSSRNLRSDAIRNGVFDLAIVSDLDKKSKVVDDKKGKWMSVMKKGQLKRNSDGSYSMNWTEDVNLYTKISEAGRGMELSALVEYNRRLYTFDDRTGLVFEVVKNKAVPRFILMEGDGNTDKGQKTEWATVKDGKMYVGSFGKEYTNPDGTIKNTNNMWVSVIDRNGVVTHEDWTARFNKVREAAGCPYPGYMIHEAITWSPARRQWVILPRRVSKEAYDENEDERRGSNTVLLASEDFGKIEVRHITPLTPTRGFSDFKFLPGSKDNVIVALKSEENEEEQTQNSYITVFDLDGRVLMEETEVPGGMKFEGLEFLSTVCNKHHKLFGATANLDLLFVLADLDGVRHLLFHDGDVGQLGGNRLELDHLLLLPLLRRRHWSRLVEEDGNGEIHHREIEGETQLGVEHDGGDERGHDERRGGRHRLHHGGQVLQDGAGHDAHVHETTSDAARRREPDVGENRVDVEVAQRDLLDGAVAVLHHEEEKVDEGTPTTSEEEGELGQVQPYVLLENGHVLVALHELLNAHASARHDSCTDDCQKRSVKGKIGKGCTTGARELDGCNGIADE